ncbi:cytochrome c oxidase assembly protein [Biscogniauxia mediterranea]|nr:cytochrome c oxidase assembly protein [Biscogniauxia mediterranea]
MSRASQLTLFGTSMFAVGTIIFVHFQQKFEKEAMHQGVVRDMEQQRIKKERQLDFDMQKALEEEYKKGQTVSVSPAAELPTKSLPDR